ncbi:MAG: hypothetical protein NVS9B15_25560 [Acidobacteriaceae bacterium]
MNARTKRATNQLQRSRVIVNQRAGEACEYCYRTGPLELAHVFGRVHLGSWSHEPAFLMLLCADDPRTGEAGCHNDIDQYRDKAKRREIEWMAVFRFALQSGLAPLAAAAFLDRYTAKFAAKRLTDSLSGEDPTQCAASSFSRVLCYCEPSGVMHTYTCRKKLGHGGSHADSKTCGRALW